MRTFVEAATGFPTFFFTVALVVVAGFWLLVAVGATGSDCFDEDVDADAWGLGGVPVAVAFSVLTALAWSASLGADLLIEPVVSSGAARILTGLVVPVAAAVAAWCATQLLVRPLHRLFPDERGPSRTTA
ncbi:hypothetical protein IM697_00045 [Streptomyces ferrugineus]|uniref:Uncharacterized protein n=1 Tax=Streptomyces ferrugineus TaxID=1413221 RepID=A0A7M2SKW4_9ACTN|nr:hypothetical protein [Streptomyces ferrugineus]QOV36912.1 hypothetical protein IM697_00045 [Streptomyces ferrugineus]